MSESDCQTSQSHFTSRTIVHRIVASLGGLFCGLLLLPTAATADEKLWALLQAGGQVVLIRHSLTTPGVGDPPAMKLDDCSTQRNLVDEGRRHAREVGAAFKARNVPVDSVLSSPWCRCIETARLAFGRAEVSESLSNLFGRPENQARAVACNAQVDWRVPRKREFDTRIARFNHRRVDGHSSWHVRTGRRHAAGRR